MKKIKEFVKNYFCSVLGGIAIHVNVPFKVFAVAFFFDLFSFSPPPTFMLLAKGPFEGGEKSGHRS